MTHTTTAEFRHPEGDRLLEFWRAEYIAHGAEPQEPEPGVLVADAGFARVTVRVSGRACRIEVACTDASMLPDYRTGISYHMAEFDPALPPLTWTGAGRAGALPPTLAIGEVTGCAPLGTSWRRVTVQLSPEGYARFSGDAHWHFRLLRAADRSRAPVWPRLDANGVIRWPEGEDSLTNRVFTIRTCDAENLTVGFDIFRHPGGPTCDWAETLPIGQTVGLMGPGAKAGPELYNGADTLLAGGDETSAPAILRSLSALPATATGEVVLLVGSPADVQAPSAAPPGLNLTWLLRSEGATEATLTAAIRASLAPAPPHTALWFAASKPAAREIRTFALSKATLPKTQVHAVSYWT